MASCHDVAYPPLWVSLRGGQEIKQPSEELAVFHLRVFIRIAAIVSIMMSTAHAQVRQELFRATPVYSFYDRGIIAAPLTTSGGRGEALKIIGSLEALLDLNRGKPAPPGGYGRQRGFEMRIGPSAIGPKHECSWTAEEISDLESASTAGRCRHPMRRLRQSKSPSRKAFRSSDSSSPGIRTRHRSMLCAASMRRPEPSLAARSCSSRPAFVTQ